MSNVILFGSGSPVIVDVEETCARRGWTVTAVVKNVAGPDYASDPARIVPAACGMDPHAAVVLPIFSPANRRLAQEHAAALGARAFPALVDPTSVLPRAIALDEGVYVNAGCIIGAASRIGRFAFINRGASLGHHLELGAFASVGPGVVAAGQVSIGEAAMIGAGAVILPGVRIGAEAVVAAGAVVRRDVPDGATVAGHPAQPVARKAPVRPRNATALPA
ncbi:DapH/DapD/GlmU-related protein [Limobrevibacterium gyesilva]|uniref:DapH/DapD/GlmU-related protein n=1 Tax=Limobrevibacterium gyesilva TaxID=2991712 RepID=UPI0024C17BB2|nr:DapH/DapD/GlmU-related protein [Limobrevibacterium gyesilva]